MSTQLFRSGMDSMRIGQNYRISCRQIQSRFTSNSSKGVKYASGRSYVCNSIMMSQQDISAWFLRGFSSGNIHQSSICQESQQNTREEKEHFPSDKGMNTRLSAENDYLSWMRNSYIMTLGGVSMLHFDLWSAGPVAGAAALLTASLNLMWGTMGYIHNLQCLRRRNYISTVMCRLAQLWALLHFTLWVMVLMVIFPDYKLIEASDLSQKYDDEEEK